MKQLAGFLRGRAFRAGLLALALLPAGPVGAGEGQPSAGRHIVVGGLSDFPPYEFVDEQGNPAGLVTDLTRAIAKVMDLDVEFRMGSRNQTRQALESGKIDVMQGMFYSREYDKFLDFSSPHNIIHFVIFTRKGFAHYDSLEELRGKEVIVVRGSAMHDQMSVKPIAGRLVVVENIPAAVRLLASEQHDCFVISKVAGTYWAKKMGLEKAVTTGDTVMTSDYGYAVREGDTTHLEPFDQGLAILKKTGEYQKLYDHWLGAFEPRGVPWPTVLRYAGWILLPLVLILSGVLLWSYSLRRQVERRTAELRREVAERQRAEAALRFSGAYNRSLIEASVDPFVTIGPDGKITDVNRATETFTGLSREDLVGTDFSNYFTEPERARAGYREVFEKGEVHDYALDLKHRDGRVHHVLYNASLYRGEDGKVIGIFAVARDVTLRKQAEEALRRAGAYNRSLIEASLDPLVTIGPDGKITDVNRATEGATGRSRSELIGTDFLDYFTEPEKARAGYREVFEKGEVHDYALEIKHRDGRVTPVLYNATVYRDEQGKVIGVFAAARDVTEVRRAEQVLRHSEESLRAAQRIAHLGNWELDLDRNVLTWSDEIYRIFEIDPQKFGASYQAFLDAIHPDDRDAVNEAYTDSLKSRTPYEIAHRLLMKDGRVKYVRERCETFYGQDGRPLRSVGTVQDVTELQRAEEALREKDEQLRQAQKMEAIGRLAGGIAHDFNNMMQVVLGYAHRALRQPGADGPLRGSLLEIRKAGERAAALTRQLLAFGRRQILRPEVLDLNTAVAEMKAMLQRVVGEDVVLITDPAPDLGLVRADRAQMEQVIVNLALNARDAMPGGGRLVIATANVEMGAGHAGLGGEAQPGPHVVLSVSDTGCGMDEDTKARIFEPFFTTKPPGAGTGLGLPTVYGIVKQSGGDIDVQSQPGRGATFRILLPRVQAAAGKAPAGPPEPAAPEADGGSETVLLVEDDNVVRSLVGAELQERGYTVLAPASVGEALIVAREHPGTIHLVLTDVTMPGMSGPTLFKALAGIRPEARVLYMSGHAEKRIVEAGVLGPGAAFLGKPFTPEALAHRVREVLDAPGGAV